MNRKCLGAIITCRAMVETHAGIAQSLQWLAAVWTSRDLSSCPGRIKNCLFSISSNQVLGTTQPTEWELGFCSLSHRSSTTCSEGMQSSFGSLCCHNVTQHRYDMFTGNYAIKYRIRKLSLSLTDLRETCLIIKLFIGFFSPFQKFLHITAHYMFRPIWTSSGV
jgi:hypothetical protein